MTSLLAFGITLAVGSSVCCLSFLCFGCAVTQRSTNIAPRCTARSKNTIYNKNTGRRFCRNFGLWKQLLLSRSSLIKSQSKHRPIPDKVLSGDSGGLNGGGGITNEEDGEEHRHPQDRGNPFTGWIPWTLGLSYETLLNGVPGTGTRKDGMEGTMLKTNLDGIVMLRFHAIGLKVAIAATLLCLCIILPLNITARCHYDSDSLECAGYDLNDFERTTLKNIPALLGESVNVTSWTGVFGTSGYIFGSPYSSYLRRLYAVSLVSIALVYYSLILLRREWVDALALRRVYYLEGYHWENRQLELEETFKPVDLDFEKDDDDNEKQQKRRLINKRKKMEPKAKILDPWVPHPEQRETVPNIELYSVLVGNIPSLAKEVVEQDDLEAAVKYTKEQALDWQLQLTATFFDHCVPNQPGFSSSVAAVTILPDAPKLALAWRKWYAHVGLIRRLRFIRRLISEKRHYEIEYDDDGDDSDNNSTSNNKYIPDAYKLKNSVRYENRDMKDIDDDSGLEHIIHYYTNILGMDEGIEAIHSDATNYGPEQIAVFTREFAQGAAACCPNGCGEERVKSFQLDELIEEEADLVERVKESYNALQEAQSGNIIRDKSKIHTIKTSAAESQLTIETHTKKVEEKRNNFDMEKSLMEKHNKSSNLVLNLSSTSAETSDYKQRVSMDPTPKPSFPTNRPPAYSLEHRGENSVVGSYASQSVRKRLISMNAQGKIVLQDPLLFTHSHDMDDWTTTTGGGPPLQEIQTPTKSGVEMHDETIDDRTLGSVRREFGNFSNSAPSRRRLNTGFSVVSSIGEGKQVKQWEQAQRIVNDDKFAGFHRGFGQRKLQTGVWKMPRRWSLTRCTLSCSKSLKVWCRQKTKDVVNDIASDSTYAIVTFTSRQAAIAARRCIADGRGAGRWTAVKDIPVPPLADAASCDFKTCRGCCRPVTLTINPKQQMVRKIIGLTLLIVVYFFSSVAITAVAAVAQPENFYKLWPALETIASESLFFKQFLSGFIAGLLFTLFFALCPVIFKALANFGSNAMSVNLAEFAALKYYWWFMLIYAFFSPTITTMILTALNERQFPDTSISKILMEVAGALPTQLSATWLNWVIIRTTATLPLQYMLQINTFIFQALGWKCCRRCVMGGGVGGPIPYRIYVDSGVVFLCIVVLSPVSPLVAPGALLYFLFCTPLWRRNCIFMYRPKFDAGGIRWPFLSEIITSSLIMGQFLLAVLLGLKKALGPSILAAIPIPIIMYHRNENRRRFLKPYMEAALMQTSLLDGWDVNDPLTLEKREAFRRFLVDAHKAAYIPICLASFLTKPMTCEPAVAVHHDIDNIFPADDGLKHDPGFRPSPEAAPFINSHFHSFRRTADGQGSVCNDTIDGLGSGDEECRQS